MRYLITFSYDGTNYSGYQKQKAVNTVQNMLEKAVSTINNKKTVVAASGRTDAGVHAINQKAHFDIDISIEPQKLKQALNSLLPKDIYIKKVVITNDSFHARYDVKSKEYIYKINIGEYNPLEKNYIWQYSKKLDINNMKKGINSFIGKHNFRSFTKVDEEKDFVREIYKAKITIKNDIITISFKGSGFLRYMVRNMVGFLVEIGLGKRKVEELVEVLEAKDRTKAGISAPPEGLYLKNVWYK